MSPVFGDHVQCPGCHGESTVKNPEIGDRAAARERARLRAHGQTVERPPSRVPCPDCAGAGMVTAAEADRQLSAFAHKLLADPTSGPWDRASAQAWLNSRADRRNGSMAVEAAT